jgi:splicing factor 3B subunit 4
MANKHWEQNKEATIYVGNLDERFGEALMWELMTQMGPVLNVHMPMDRVSRTHQGYGFVEFDTPDSADYAARCLNGIRVFGKPVRVNKASADKQRSAEIGAELFVNNLDPQVDEKILYDTFAQFGQLVAPPNVVRDANNISKGYGFVSFDSFEASDAARDTMSGQYLLSKQITVEYAYKKDGKGERHGDEAERKLAAEGKKHNIAVEQQPLPPAFLMTAQSAAASTPAAQPTPAVPAGFEQNLPPPQQPPFAAVPPPAVPAGFGGARAPPAGFGSIPPPVGAARPGGGALPPPPPSGLPARPPPSQGGFNGPPSFLPGAPPPSSFGGAPPPPMGAAIPPPGFAPPPAFSGANGVPLGAPPPGFMPPPGFAPPGQAPPAGFGRR